MRRVKGEGIILRLFGTVSSSAYGVTWLISLLLGVALMLWGALVVGRRAEALNVAKTTEEFNKVFGLLKIVAPIEILAFLAIFTCMILMRLGY